MEPKTSSPSLGTQSNHMDSPHKGRIKLPGFGLPVNTLPDDHFPTAHGDWKQYWPHTIRERCMVAFMEEVTLEENWPSKVFDDTEIARWEADVLVRDWEKSSNIRHGDFTETMFRYCMDELREKARLYRETGIVPILDIEVYLGRSDQVISQELCQSLKKATKDLESTRPHTQHPNLGSVGTAVDIIDPDLYALYYGFSKALADKEISLSNCLGHTGTGELVPKPPKCDFIGQFDRDEEVTMSYYYSLTSQWLPCNVQFSDGNNARITSYVNNLHPRDHADLYSLLEKVITQAMPLWGLVYGSVRERDEALSMRIDCPGADWKYPSTPPYDPLGLRDDLFNGLIDDDEWQRRTNSWLKAQKIIDKPEPNVGPVWGNHGRKCKYQRIHEITAGKNGFLEDLTRLGSIQVIVKLSALYPTPESPICSTENEWTLDGVPNEHIIATAVYVFDDDNVTDTEISFQSRFYGPNFEEEGSFEPGDIRGVEEIFGFRPRDPSVQDIGSATLREGSMLVYPNVLQHKWSFTQLKDPTKPGHRKFLTLYLVDPRVKILSTANVPPQQADWWAREFSDETGQFNELPKEVVDMILDEVKGCPFSMRQANRWKRMAVKERKRVSRQIIRALTSYRMDLGTFGDFFEGALDNESEDYIIGG